MIAVEGSTAGMVESITFTREPGSCEHGDQHDRYEISWTRPDGTREAHHVHWCPAPLCDESPWHFPSTPLVKLTAWVSGRPNIYDAVATAYLLAITEVRDGQVVAEMQARIGICDQWKDRSHGNYAEPDEEPKLFTERYFAESGPGIYPAHITTKGAAAQ
ncbi:MAG: hypothetical protein K2Y33_03310 [Mycolicibacterium frederiksbergense]|nr:hypothetical protein [Mycolicibacterium frederiksbergense]